MIYNYNSNIEVGQVIKIICANNDTSAANTLDGNNFIKCNGIYNKSDYPVLANLLNNVGATNFIARTSNTTGTIYSMTYGNGLFVYAAYNNVISTSTDAVTWTRRTSGTTELNSIDALGYGNGLYLYGNSTGHIATSTDAITWTGRTSGTTSIILSIGYGNGIYIFGTSLGGLSTSTNGTAWTSRTSGSTDDIVEITYGNGLYVYANTSGGVYTSTNATAWTYRARLSTFGMTLDYGNGLFIAGGSYGGINTSANGVTWTPRSIGISTNESVTAIGYGNGLYLIGLSNYVLSSNDAISWKKRFVQTITFPESIAYGNGRWVVAGYSGKLESSNSVINYEYSNFYDYATQFYVPKVEANTTGNKSIYPNTWPILSNVKYEFYVRAK